MVGEGVCNQIATYEGGEQDLGEYCANRLSKEKVHCGENEWVGGRVEEAACSRGGLTVTDTQRG